MPTALQVCPVQVTTVVFPPIFTDGFVPSCSLTTNSRVILSPFLAYPLYWLLLYIFALVTFGAVVSLEGFDGLVEIDLLLTVTSIKAL